jgi:hypothetical protein
MKTLILGLLLSISSLASAQVLVVDIWKSLPGQNQQTVKYGQEAVAIINRLGGSASIGVDMDGRMHFVTNHENWAAYAKNNSKVQSSKEWGSFLAKFASNPSAEQEANYLLNTPSPGKDGNVYQVFIWEAELGRGGDMFQAGQEAKAIHEKAGASITIHADQMQNMHYVMNFDSWDAWAKFQDTTHPEFQAFMQKQQQSPNSRLIKVYTAESL